MSTGSSASTDGVSAEFTDRATPNAIASPSRIPGDALAAGSTADLAVRAAAFVDEFERWAGRKAVAAGASAPRLRLLYSVHCHGPQKMADLAEALTVTPRNVTALVDALEAEGLVRRVPHSTDRRVTLVELTCNRDLVASQFRAYQDSIAGLFAALDETDQQTLLRLLTSLHERIHAESQGSTAREETPDA